MEVILLWARSWTRWSLEMLSSIHNSVTSVQWSRRDRLMMLNHCITLVFLPNTRCLLLRVKNYLPSFENCVPMSTEKLQFAVTLRLSKKQKGNNFLLKRKLENKTLNNNLKLQEKKKLKFSKKPKPSEQTWCSIGKYSVQVRRLDLGAMIVSGCPVHSVTQPMCQSYFCSNCKGFCLKKLRCYWKGIKVAVTSLDALDSHKQIHVVTCCILLLKAQGVPFSPYGTSWSSSLTWHSTDNQWKMS